MKRAGYLSLRGECNEPWQSTGNQISLVAGLLRFARNDGELVICEANEMSRGNPLVIRFI